MGIAKDLIDLQENRSEYKYNRKQLNTVYDLVASITEDILKTTIPCSEVDYKDLRSNIVNTTAMQLYTGDLVFKSNKTVRIQIAKIAWSEYEQYVCQTKIDPDEYREVTIPRKLHDSYIRSQVEEVLSLLEPQEYALFLSYYKTGNNAIYGVLNQLTITLFQYCKRELDKVFAANTEEIDTSMKDANILVFLAKLSEIDPKLVMLPKIIGSRNFSRLLRTFGGTTLRFPGKHELKGIINNTVGLTSFKKASKEITLDEAALRVFKSLVSKDLDSYVYKRDLLSNLNKGPKLNRLMITTYIESLFKMHRDVENLLQLEEITDPQMRMEIYRLKFEDSKLQYQLLNSVSKILSSISSNNDPENI